MKATGAAIILVLSLMNASIVLGHAGDDEGDWDERWHDFGTDLGAFGDSPVGDPVGVCWYTDSTFFAEPDVAELNGHRGGLGADFDGDCDDQVEGQDDPSVHGTFSASTSLLPGGEDGPLVSADAEVNDFSVSDLLPGVTDLNDGWFHIVTSPDAVLDGGVVRVVDTDDDGLFTIYQELWYGGAVGDLPYRLAIGDAAKFPHAALAFSSVSELAANIDETCANPIVCQRTLGERATFYSTGVAGITPTPADGGKRLVYEVPVADLIAAQGGDELEPFATWSDVKYVPRDPATGQAHSNGAPSGVRTDHPGADDDACRADPSDEPWTNCPSTGGFFSGVQNAIFFAGFGDQDPYANEGGDAEGTPYGANDEVVAALGGDSSSQQAELGLKGHIDRIEYLISGTAEGDDPGVGEPPIPEDLPIPGELPLPEDLDPTGADPTASDITDGYATIVRLTSGMGGLTWATNPAGNYVVRASVYEYNGGLGSPMDLYERLGKPAAIRIAAADSLLSGDDPVPSYDCANPVGPGYIVKCGTIGQDFGLAAGRTEIFMTLDAAELGPLAGQPVAISVWIDATDESSGTFGVEGTGSSYEAGNGWYNPVKTAVAASQAASSMDWGATPVLLE